jgi:hypothetical protein
MLVMAQQDWMQSRRSTTPPGSLEVECRCSAGLETFVGRKLQKVGEEGAVVLNTAFLSKLLVAESQLQFLVRDYIEDLTAAACNRGRSCVRPRLGS